MNFPSIRPEKLAIFIGILIVIRIIFYFYEKYSAKQISGDRSKTQEEYSRSEKSRALIKEYLDSIIIAGITALILIKFIVQPFYIPSGSMYPTLKKWDFILVNKFVYKFKEPKAGDIVVFHPPPEALAGDKDYIKRIIAAGKDTLEVKNGNLYINGQLKTEPYVENKADYEYSLVKIPQGKFFVMGDNRSNSGDSHVWGFLPEKNVVGKAIVIIWPPGRVRILR